MIGNHRADESLLELARRHPRVFVVTRNSHAEEIVAFLQLSGIDAAVDVDGGESLASASSKVNSTCSTDRGFGVLVRSVKAEGVDKADVILNPSFLPDGKAAVFVDDDPRELLHPRIHAAAEQGILQRVLFVRG